MAGGMDRYPARRSLILLFTPFGGSTVSHLKKNRTSDPNSRRRRAAAVDTARQLDEYLDDPHQLDLFGKDAEEMVDLAQEELYAGDVRCTRRDLQHFGRALVAKYLSHCLGQPVAMIGRLLHVDPGTASRLVRANLPFTCNPMPKRTRSDQVMEEMGMRRTVQPNGKTTRFTPADH